MKEDQALVTGDQASIAVAADAIEQAEVNLGYCTIRSPIDGVVVTRNADEGQTVTASLSVPSLFVMATDIDRLELVALIDEVRVPNAALRFKPTPDVFHARPGPSAGGASRFRNDRPLLQGAASPGEHRAGVDHGRTPTEARPGRARKRGRPRWSGPSQVARQGMEVLLRATTEARG